MEYNVIIGLSNEMNDFIQNVDDALRDGWHCQGGISVSTDEDGTEWAYQAMVKVIENDHI